MKTYDLPNPKLLLLRDSADEGEKRTERVSALYGETIAGEKYMTPEIWLYGEWLEKAGFEIGDTIGIEIHQGELRILKLKI